MRITQEQKESIAHYPEGEHAHIVDAFAALARDPMTIAIRQGIDPEDILLILHAYGLEAGEEWGDAGSDAGALRRCPERAVKEYVAMYYPGIAEGEMPSQTLQAYVISYTEAAKKEKR